MTHQPPLIPDSETRAASSRKAERDDPGDIVFDGFCGTGMTGVAAQLCNDRKEVGELGYRVDEEGLIYDGDEAISRLGARKALLVDLSHFRRDPCRACVWT